MKFRQCLVLFISLLSVGFAVAQETCPAVIQEALSSLHDNCSLTERNQACYGNISLEAVPQRGITQFKFDDIGDIANLEDIRMLDLAPLDAAAEQWGLVMMRMQADIPDTLPGQNVTFILFGDVTIENAAKEDQTPMQSFYLTTGTGDASCAEAPESGLMVQTPSGIKEVSFTVNGVEVEMGSTVIFQAERGKKMRVKTVEGKAKLKIGDKTIPVVQGSEYSAPINENLEITQPEQGTVEGYHEEDVHSIPVRVLDRPIRIAKPLTPVQIEEVKVLQEAQEPLCSDEVGSYLPPCTHPIIDSQGQEVQHSEDGNVVLVDETGTPLFYDKDGHPITTMDDYYRHLSYWNDTSTLTDNFGNTVEVSEDGTVSVVDLEGNTFVSEPDGTYVYTEVTGATQTVEAPSLDGSFLLDDEGTPTVIDESGNVFPEPTEEIGTTGVGNYPGETSTEIPSHDEMQATSEPHGSPPADAPQGFAPPPGDAPPADGAPPHDQVPPPEATPG